MINGVNPKWGTKTVTVSYTSGDVINSESRGKKEANDDSAAMTPD